LASSFTRIVDWQDVGVLEPSGGSNFSEESFGANRGG
jgi:hypothetical protein